MSGNFKLSPSTPLVGLPRRAKIWTSLGLDRFTLVKSLDWTVVLTLTLLVFIGLGLRATQLGAVGFAEDEMNKLDAVQSYEHGDFTANAEHPMLMKVLMLISLRAVPTNCGRGVCESLTVSDKLGLSIPQPMIQTSVNSKVFICEKFYRLSLPWQ